MLFRLLLLSGSLRERLSRAGGVGAVLVLAVAPVQAQPGWTVNPGDFAFDMIIQTAALTLDGVRSTDDNDQVAVFVGDEVRGVGTLQERGTSGLYAVSFRAYANANGETLTFKAYDASEGATRDLCTELLFITDATRIGLDLHASDGSSTGTCPLNWQAVPGYTGSSMTFNASASVEGTPSTDDQDRVAAFIGPEVRGVGIPGSDGSGGQVFPFTIEGGTAGQTITFLIYDASTATTYTVNETLSYSSGAQGGTVALTTDAVLPVELTAFRALADQDAVVLHWTTASETNNSGFEVQHQPPTKTTFAPVAFVEGQGTTLAAQTYQHTLANLEPGRHRFRLKQVDYDGVFAYSPTIELEIDLSEPYALGTAYPNPFNPEAHFTLSVQQEQRVRIAVYDALGRQVAHLHDGPLQAGQTHAFVVDGTAWTSGLYMVRVVGERFVRTQSLLLLK